MNTNYKTSQHSGRIAKQLSNTLDRAVNPYLAKIKDRGFIIPDSIIDRCKEEVSTNVRSGSPVSLLLVDRMRRMLFSYLKHNHSSDYLDKMLAT